jgi:hypothetical protein
VCCVLNTDDSKWADRGCLYIFNFQQEVQVSGVQNITHIHTQVTLRATCTGTHEEIRSTVCSISLDIFRDPEIQLDPAVDL